MNETRRNALHLALGIILFPGTVLLVVPGLLVYLYGFTPPHPSDVGYWFSKLLLPGGFVLAGWTVALFFVHGRGTPVPWHPPKHLVVLGPYRYVRNPMMIAVLMMLVGEALLLSSPSIGWWATGVGAFIAAFVLFYEEPGLERRFGEDYRLYKANVRRWLPRLSPWTPPWDGDTP